MPVGYFAKNRYSVYAPRLKYSNDDGRKRPKSYHESINISGYGELDPYTSVRGIFYEFPRKNCNIESNLDKDTGKLQTFSCDSKNAPGDAERATYSTSSIHNIGIVSVEVSVPITISISQHNHFSMGVSENGEQSFAVGNAAQTQTVIERPESNISSKQNFDKTLPSKAIAALPIIQKAASPHKESEPSYGRERSLSSLSSTYADMYVPQVPSPASHEWRRASKKSKRASRRKFQPLDYVKTIEVEDDDVFTDESSLSEIYNKIKPSKYSPAVARHCYAIADEDAIRHKLWRESGYLDTSKGKLLNDNITIYTLQMWITSNTLS